MAHWRDGIEPDLFRLNYRDEDYISTLEDISAVSPKGGLFTLKKGLKFHAAMKGGFLFCSLGGNKYNEAAILPADFAKVQIVHQPAQTKKKASPSRS